MCVQCVHVYIQTKDCHALVATGFPNQLKKLRDSNALLEEIQKGLNDYLEKKRLYFARYAITKLELLLYSGDFPKAVASLGGLLV